MLVMSSQAVKGPIRNTTAFGAPGVRFRNKRVGSADTDPGAGGEEFLVRMISATYGGVHFRDVLSDRLEDFCRTRALCFAA